MLRLHETAKEKEYLDSLISEVEASYVLGVSIQFLERLRKNKKAPSHVTKGRSVYYTRRELIQWARSDKGKGIL